MRNKALLITLLFIVFFLSMNAELTDAGTKSRYYSENCLYSEQAYYVEDKEGNTIGISDFEIDGEVLYLLSNVENKITKTSHTQKVC